MFQSQKRLSKWRQHIVKMVNHLFSKSSKFCIVRTVRFCSNFTSMWSKYLSNSVWRDFRLPMSPCSNYNVGLKYPIRKSFFTVNLPSKLLPTAVANADIGNVKSLNTFLLKCLYHMLVKFERNRMVQTTRNFELLTKNRDF